MPRKEVEQRLLIPRSFGELNFLFPEIKDPATLLALSKLNPSPFIYRNLALWRFTGTEPQMVIRDKTGKLEGVDLASLSKADGIVIRIDPSVIMILSEEIGTLVSHLSPNHGVWIIEKINQSSKILDRPEQEIRENSLEILGLVKRKVINLKGTPFCLWYGRTEKATRRGEFDLTQKPWFPFLRQKFIEGFAEDGWRVEMSEVLERCRHSKFPYFDFLRLKEGTMPVIVAAPCGCQWRVDHHGCWLRLNRCPDEDCEGIPPKKEKTRRQFLIGLNIPAEAAIGREMSCGDCGSALLFDRVVSPTEGEWLTIESDLKCPSCGLIGMTRTMRVKKDQVVIFEPRLEV